MAEQSHQEKTELATPRRRKEARKKGQVARSTELSSFVVILAGLLSLLALSPLFLEKLLGILTSSLSFEGSRQVTAEHYDSLVLLWTEHGVAGVLPFWGILLIAAFGVAAMQVGLHVQWDQLAFKGERISPLRGFKRIFSVRSGFELIKSLLKFAVLLTLAWITLNGEKDSLMNLASLDLGPALLLLGSVAMKLCFRLILLLLVLAVLDYSFQRWKHEKDIMMTRQELKDELKEYEGDPLVKGRLKALQREISMQRMMEDVKKADLVLTNPTHYAVALLYEEGANAPKVVAKGQRKVAARIREIAREHGVAVVENKPLARALYAEAKVGESIPLKFYQAVAEVLAWVYRLSGREAVGSSA